IVDPFTQDDFVTVEELQEARPAIGDEETAPDFSALDDYLVETAAALDCLPQVALTDDAAARVRLGNPVIVRGRDAPVEADEACATARGKLVAIGSVEAGQFKPKRVFTA
ncbi:MAG TPA: tRNA pseudouridine(55) synthase TruB, partial [Tianweitania sediminis]|nr:tRNA pseudouridine(55) synthase TruB [Tianweitania sediminis]